MTPTEALQHILAKIHSESAEANCPHLIDDIREAAEVALENRPISEGHMTFSFNGFTSSRRGIDAVLKAIVLRHDGSIALTEGEIERCRRDYGLRIEGYDGGITLIAREQR